MEIIVPLAAPSAISGRKAFRLLITNRMLCKAAQNKGAADQTKQFSRCSTPCLNDVNGGHIGLFGVPINELVFDFSKSEVSVAKEVKWTSSKLKPAVAICNRRNYLAEIIITIYKSGLL